MPPDDAKSSESSLSERLRRLIMSLPEDEQRRERVIERGLPRFAQPHVLFVGWLHGEPALSGNHLDKAKVPDLVGRLKERNDHPVHRPQQAKEGDQ